MPRSPVFPTLTRPTSCHGGEHTPVTEAVQNCMGCALVAFHWDILLSHTRDKSHSPASGLVLVGLCIPEQATDFPQLQLKCTSGASSPALLFPFLCTHAESRRNPPFPEVSVSAAHRGLKAILFTLC